MIKIDGVTYDVPIVSLKRNADFLDKYAKRNTSGELLRKLIGVYFNYSLELAWKPGKGADYRALWDKLTQPVEYHSVTLYDEDGEYTFTAYVSGVSDEIVRVENEVICKGLKCEFIAKSPARRPS